MTIRKFGTGEGRVTEVEQDENQGISREAAAGSQDWTKQDSEELAEENRD